MGRRLSCPILLIVVLVGGQGCTRTTTDGGVEASQLKKVVNDEKDIVKLQGIASELLDRNAKLHTSLVAQSLWLSGGLMVTGTIVLVGLIFMIYKKALAEATFYRLFILSFVITAALFLIVAGFGQDQITPVIGLLGTITGYILGKQPEAQSPGVGTDGTKG